MDVDVDVLVVGAGPVGLTAARLAGDAGLTCRVVERRSGPQSAPAAHVVNARTLEVLRQAGVDMDAVAAIAADPADAGHVNFLTTLRGELLGRLPFERQGDDCLAHTPTPLRNISQHRLEPILATEAAASPGVELRYGVEWVACEQDADGVTSVVRPADGGAEVVVRSRWLVAADGAASPVRKSLGIAMVGPASLQSFVAVHLRADLRAVLADRPGVLHFVVDPASPGVFVGHDAGREWVFMVAYDPDHESVADFDDERCRALVRAAIGEVDGGADVPVEVVGVGTWHMSAQVAERVRDGRVLLVGDAAHRFPPTGGLGLNTGVADAHNLVWKLAAVEAGWASPSLLDTYEAERLPVAQANCARSEANAATTLVLYEALEGDDPAATEAALAAQAPHFDMLGLQLGYTYGEGALVRAGERPAPLDPVGFDPRGAVGARLPHAWLADGRSTLDLVPPGRLVLLSVGEHDTWAAALDGALAGAAVPVDHVRLGVDADVDPVWAARCGLGAGTALVVRPDQHVAWRSDEWPEAAPADALALALGAVT